MYIESNLVTLPVFSANILHSFDPLKTRLLLRRVHDLKFLIHGLLFIYSKMNILGVIFFK